MKKNDQSIFELKEVTLNSLSLKLKGENEQCIFQTDEVTLFSPLFKNFSIIYLTKEDIVENP